MVRIRPASPNDLERILDGARDFSDRLTTSKGVGLFFDRDKARPFFLMMLNNPTLFTVLVAEHDDTIAGAICASVSPWMCNIDSMLMDEVFFWVFPEYRHTSCGPRLLRELLKRAQEMGATSISMALTEDLGNAEKLDHHYRKLGFVPGERRYFKRLIQEG